MATIRILLTTAVSVAMLAGLALAAPVQACDSRSDPDCAPAESAATNSPQQIAPPQRQTRRVQKARKSQRAAQRSGTSAIMGGESSIALIARLPWWRADQPHLLFARMNSEVESQVLVAADAWLVTFASTNVAAGKGDRIELASTDGLNDVALNDLALNDLALATDQATIVDSGELNEIDLTATQAPAGPDQSWLHTLLALLGGALAAASTARIFLV